jgi:hypothetical protein
MERSPRRWRHRGGIIPQSLDRSEIRPDKSDLLTRMPRGSEHSYGSTCPAVAGTFETQINDLELERGLNPDPYEASADQRAVFSYAKSLGTCE